jgi:hypothetical protein
MNPSHPVHPGSRLGHDTLEARFALRVAARLTAQAEGLPHDVTERLRFARERALKRARTAAQPTPAGAPAQVGNGQIALGGGDASGWWSRLASLAPAAALVAGLLLMQSLRSDERERVTADIDAALLADTLPPSAYADPGFAEFLRAPVR